MHFKDTTTIFEKSNKIISKVPWKNDIYHSGLTFTLDSYNPDINNKYIKIDSNHNYNYKFKLNTDNITNLIFEYFYNNVSKRVILHDTSVVDYLISVNLDANSHLKIYTCYDCDRDCGCGGCGGCDGVRGGVSGTNGDCPEGYVNIYDIKRYECINDEPNNIVNNLEIDGYRGEYDKIYIINLEHRTDRKESVIKQLEKEGITNYEFINAVNGTDSTILKKFNKIRKNGSKIGTPGHLGCLLSHKKVLLKAKEDNVKQFMILEDDVIFKDGFMDRLNDVFLPDWECIYLSAPLEEKKLFFNGWAKHSKYCTTHAMIIKASIIDYLLDLLKDCDDYIDRIYSHTLQKHKKTYLLDDIVLTSDANDTNTSRKNKKFLYMVKNYNLGSTALKGYKDYNCL
jgi:hypothetical protein